MSAKKKADVLVTKQSHPEQFTPEAMAAKEKLDNKEATRVKEEAEEDLKDAVEEFVAASKQDVLDVLEALKELTKAIAELTKENTKWYRAGKMALPYVLTPLAVCAMLLA